MEPQSLSEGKDNLWVFGYGSLVWRPDFSYKKSKVGFIMGYKRRFWHGDEFHRGDKEKVIFVTTFCSWSGSNSSNSWWMYCINCFFMFVVVVDRNGQLLTPCPCSPQPGRVVTLVEDHEVNIMLLWTGFHCSNQKTQLGKKISYLLVIMSRDLKGRISYFPCV